MTAIYEIPPKPSQEPPSPAYRRLKRVRRKSFTQVLTARLADRHGMHKGSKSRCSKSYSHAYHCGQKLSIVNGKAVTRYCKTRHCTVCNNIRSAMLMNGYLLQLQPYLDAGTLYFVTLTAPTPRTGELTPHLKVMMKYWIQVRNKACRAVRNLVGLRKLECHVRPGDRVHPHFHLLVVGKHNATWLKWEWLKRWKGEAHHGGQDIRKADKNSLIEMFKYMTKAGVGEGTQTDANGKTRRLKLIYTDKEVDQLDAIYCALRGKRTIQPFGGLRKVSEEIDEDDLTNALVPPNEDDEHYVWHRQLANYVGTTTGQLFADWEPSKRLLEALQGLHSPPEREKLGTHAFVYWKTPKVA